MENTERRCYNCHFCAAFDSGYSNWTVEETTLHCLLDLNPHMPVDESYSWIYGDSNTKDHEIFKIAESCPSYQHTNNIVRIDVEGEDLHNYKDDPQYHALLQKAYDNN